jgi:hypothetical protein
LIDQFNRENIKLSKCFDDKLHHESPKMGKLGQHVRDEKEAELVAVKKDIQAVSKELHNKLESHVLKTMELTSKLGNQITLHKENTDTQVNEMKDAIKNV